MRSTDGLWAATTPDELTVWAVAVGLKGEVERLIQQTFEASRSSVGSAVWAPLWFSGGGGFGSVGGVGSAGDFTNMIGSISATAASSSGSGFSGGGGGGGAGGGF